MHPVAHWTFKLVDPTKALPVAPEHFKAAEGCLAARTLSHHEIGPELRTCACIACAGDAIQKLAVEYNTNRLLNEGAPRSTDVQAEIDTVLLATEALLKALTGMSDYTRKAFEHHPDMPSYLGQFDDEADPPAYASYSDLDCELISNLITVRRDAAAVSAKYRKRSSSLDRGGNTNLFKEEHGSPDSNLVKSGWIVFENFQPGKARGTTTNGAFHEFLGHVYGYATGKDPENYSGLAVWIKALAVLLRKRQDCLGEQIAVEREIGALEAIDPDQASKESALHCRRKLVQQKLEKIEHAIRMARPGKKAAVI
jgi:hypothetical protein